MIIHSPAFILEPEQKRSIHFHGMLKGLLINGYQIDVFAVDRNYYFVIANDGVYWDAKMEYFEAGLDVAPYQKKRCLW